MRRPDINNPLSVASRFRRKRFGFIEQVLRAVLEHKESVSILDIGGRRSYWSMLASDLSPKISLTVLNLENEIAIERQAAGNDALDIRHRVGDGCAMPEFGDRAFDLVHANSVIEHVGSLQNMIRFAAETRRVGNAYYVQTPYLWFPIEPHFGVPFLHWLPGPSRAQILSRVRLGYADGRFEYPAALAKADHTQIVDKTLMRRLFPDGALTRERFALMTKSLITIRAPVFG